MRMFVECFLTDDVIGTPAVYTDGVYVWTEEYIFYVKKGLITLDSSFYKYMEMQNFKIPKREELPGELINEIKDYFAVN
jgi:hypothetical protein